jgi:hypothetical protein
MTPARNKAGFALIWALVQQYPRLSELAAMLTPWFSQVAPVALQQRWQELSHLEPDWQQLKQLPAQEQEQLWSHLVLVCGVVGFPPELLTQLERWAFELEYPLAALETEIAAQRQALGRDLEEDTSDWVLRTCHALNVYLETGSTPFYGFYSQRLLHFLSNGRSSDLWMYVAGLFAPPVVTAPDYRLLPHDWEPWLQTVHQDGYARFPKLLPAPAVQELVQFAEQTPCLPSYHDREVHDPVTGKLLIEPILFDPLAPVARRYNFMGEQIVAQPAVQALMAHADLWAVAQAYLQAEPQLVLVSMWWSSDFQGPESRYTGQVFHIDIDRFACLSFFFCLTEVRPANGPHVYLRGSHRAKPLDLAVDKRMSEEELLAHYAPEYWQPIMGPAGTAFAADTKAYHRGIPLQQGCRLMLQLEFATDRFGENTPRVPVAATDASFATLRAQFPERFVNYPMPLADAAGT